MALPLVCLLFLTSCTRGSEERSVLNQGPRFPDDEGVVTDVNFERLVLDGARIYRISSEVESFTTRGHDITPLVHWKDRYVHLAVNAQREAVWISGIGVVAKTEPPRVIYTGIFEGISRSRAVFRDGTTLDLAQGVSAPAKGREAVATIDPSAHQVVEIREQEARSPQAMAQLVVSPAQ